jgi:hypothetical protein
MIEVKISPRRALMRVSLIDRIQAQDFTDTVTPAAERMRARHGSIAVLLLDVRRFQGWGACGAFAAQNHFLRRFGRSVERVAVLGPGAWRGIVPAIGALFVVAEVRSFAPGQAWLLRRWLRSRR